jgi:hypothetical protein
VSIEQEPPGDILDRFSSVLCCVQGLVWFMTFLTLFFISALMDGYGSTNRGCASPTTPKPTPRKSNPTRPGTLTNLQPMTAKQPPPPPTSDIPRRAPSTERV